MIFTAKCTLYRFLLLLALLGSRDGTVVRAGSIPVSGVICGLSLLLVLALAPMVFVRVLRFPSLHKNTLNSKFQFDQDRGPA